MDLPTILIIVLIVTLFAVMATGGNDYV